LLIVTEPQDAVAAVHAALDRFGRIDILVNNPASFYAGYSNSPALDGWTRSTRRLPAKSPHARPKSALQLLSDSWSVGIFAEHLQQLLWNRAVQSKAMTVIQESSGKAALGSELIGLPGSPPKTFNISQNCVSSDPASQLTQNTPPLKCSTA
jgi:hypothetical protein